jgi:hypothetical protein
VQAAILAFIAAAPMSATLCLECEVRAASSDCEILPEVPTLPSSVRPMVIAECITTTCSPPRHPYDQDNCEIYSRHVNPDYFLIRADDDTAVEGAFMDTGNKCGDFSLLRFDRRLRPGRYSIRNRAFACTVHAYDSPNLTGSLLVVTPSVGCSGGGHMGLSDLVLGVNVALGRGDVSACPLLDDDRDHRISIEELTRAVEALLMRR